MFTMNNEASVDRINKWNESENASHGIADLYKSWNLILEILVFKFLRKMWRKCSTWLSCVGDKCLVKRKLLSDESENPSHGIADLYQAWN